MELSSLSAYEIIEDRRIDDLNSQGTLLKHKKTGARIALLKNEDKNKVFCIGFRTPPTDSTGVAHIIEHTVLCGSDKYPVKDPFIELAKGSLNTFLNAMTFPDKTVYPVASCNDKDFANLMDVYLDAVFHPNIYKEKKIFQQEGWHYECENQDAPITINGVVYSEMKGAYSSADDLLERQIMDDLYPDTAYGVDSGGHPSAIPDLTYEDFIAFHKSYYHPSNSYIYLYGDMDMAEKLAYIDEEYLSKYDYLEIDSSIQKQEKFSAPVKKSMQYPILDSEDEEGLCYFSYNVSLESSLDKELYVALQVLDYALCSTPGSPVKMALQKKGIGEDVYSTFENGIMQPYFSFIAKNCKKEDEQTFVDTIEETLRELVKNGLDKNALCGALNYFEFKYKEADFGSYPKGLMYGLQSFDSWLYDEMQPFMHIEANDTFKKLKQRVETDYFVNFIQEHILDNTHKLILSMYPEKGLEKKQNDELTELLAKKKASLTKEEIQQIIDEDIALKEYQSSEDDPEDLAKIPVLSREDLEKKALDYRYTVEECPCGKLVSHDIFTNGVSYFRFAFDIRDMKAEDLPYMGLLKAVLGLVDTENYTYGDLFNEVSLRTGGISVSVTTFINAVDTEKFGMNFDIKGKMLYEKSQGAIALVKEVLMTSKLSDKARLREILGETKSRMQAQMSGGGHSVAVGRAMSFLTNTGYLDSQLSGYGFYLFVTDLLANFDEKIDIAIAKMEEMLAFALQKKRMTMDYIGTKEGKEMFLSAATTFVEALAEGTEAGDRIAIPERKLEKEGLTSSAAVQYVCRAGSFGKQGLTYTGALRVLKVMMGYDYLWNNVRVLGGAYGCMSGFSKSGMGYFVSYRDPNLEKTLEVYENATQYLENFEADEETLTKYVIGAIAEKDIPLTPSAEGVRSYQAYLTGYTLEMEQKERDEILSCQAADINRLAPYVQAILNTQALCVVGNDEKIKENSALFTVVKPLF